VTVLLLAALVGSIIGFAVLLPYGIAAALAGMTVGGAAMILAAGLLLALRRRSVAVKDEKPTAIAADMGKVPAPAAYQGRERAS
jgi:hypothetical protein